ncbi:MAG: peptidylprolyl isomerase [Thermoguttaceae bacterium]
MLVHRDVFQRLFQHLQHLRSSRDLGKQQRQVRRLTFEPLEERLALNSAPILKDLPEFVNLTPGTSYHIALDGLDADKDALTFTVENSNQALLNASVLEGNESVKFTVYQKDSQGKWVSLGDITFELFENEAPITTERIKEIIAGTPGVDGKTVSYDGVQIHRIMDGFMFQGGDVQYGNAESENLKYIGMGGTGTKFQDEYKTLLQFSGRGIVATANSGANTNDSQFFITDNATTWLQDKHNIFGFVTSGDDVREKVNSLPVMNSWNWQTNAWDGPKTLPASPLKMDDFQVFTDTENGTLRVVVPANAQPGTSTLTVTVADGNGGVTSYDITVNVIAKPTGQPNWAVQATADIRAGESYSFTVPDFGFPGEIQYKVSRDPQLSSENVQVSISGKTVTVLAPPNSAGVQWIVVEAIPLDYDDPQYSGLQPGFQYVGLFVTPDAPTLKLADSADTGTVGDKVTSKNNASGNELVFEVSGIVDQASLTMYRDGYEIPFDIVTSVLGSDNLWTMTVKLKAENAQQVLGDGTYYFSATQTITPPSVLQHAAMTSAFATQAVVVVDTKSPVFRVPSGNTIFDAAVGTELNVQFQTDDHLAGKVRYTIDSVLDKDGKVIQTPNGMVLSAESGQLSWTPTKDQVADYTILVRATDGAGNTSTKSIQVVFQSGAEYTITGNTTVDEGTTIELRLQLTDPDYEGTVSFEILSGSLPSGKNYTLTPIDDHSAVFTWVTTEVDGPATYDVVFILREEDGSIRRKSVTLTVLEVDDPPKWTNDFPAQYPLREHEEFTLRLTAQDADIYPGESNALVYSLVDSYPPGLTLNPTSGELKWTPDENCGSFMFEVTVRVTDKTGLYDQKTLIFAVEETDRPPVFGETEAEDTFSANTGTLLNEKIQARDPDYVSDPEVPINRIRYSLVQDSYIDGLSIDPNTGVLSWNVPSGFLENQLTGKISVEVLAEEISPNGDVGLTNTKTFVIELTNKQLMDQLAQEAAQMNAYYSSLSSGFSPFSVPISNSLMNGGLNSSWGYSDRTSTGTNVDLSFSNSLDLKEQRSKAGLGHGLNSVEIDIEGYGGGGGGEETGETTSETAGDAQESEQEKKEKERRRRTPVNLRKEAVDYRFSDEDIQFAADVLLNQISDATTGELAEYDEHVEYDEYGEYAKYADDSAEYAEMVAAMIAPTW